MAYLEDLGRLFDLLGLKCRCLVLDEVVLQETNCRTSLRTRCRTQNACESDASVSQSIVGQTIVPCACKRF